MLKTVGEGAEPPGTATFCDSLDFSYCFHLHVNPVSCGAPVDASRC